MLVRSLLRSRNEPVDMYVIVFVVELFQYEDKMTADRIFVLLYIIFLS